MYILFMKYLFLSLFVLLSSCKEKSLSPIGQEYVLVNKEVPMEITLGFNPDGRFYGKAVNDYWGLYHIHDNVISFSGITSTMKADILPRMRVERKYFDSLTNGHTFEMKEDHLKIFFDETGILEFKIKKESNTIPL